MQIDTSFDFRTDASGRDPDAYSPTLKLYHQLLWSKRLPCGRDFQLDANRLGSYVHHDSELGEFVLASDSVIPSYTRWKSMRHIIELFPEEDNEAFRAIGYTIGGMMIFPAKRVDGKQTINGARGFNRKIADRLDLTLECIRRHYLGQESPLAETLARYWNFFALFRNFPGYVDFFLLQDLVSADYLRINFFKPFDDFGWPSVPQDGGAYVTYREASIAFVHARNRRIAWEVNHSA